MILFLWYNFRVSKPLIQRRYRANRSYSKSILSFVNLILDFEHLNYYTKTDFLAAILTVINQSKGSSLRQEQYIRNWVFLKKNCGLN